MILGTTVHSVRNGLVICAHVKLATFEKVTEMPDSQVDGEQLPTECAVLGFSWLQFAKEERHRVKLTIDFLLKNDTNGNIRGVDHQVIRRGRMRVTKRDGVSKGILDSVESGRRGVGPDERAVRLWSPLQETMEGRQGSSEVRLEPVIEVDQPEELTELPDAIRARKVADGLDAAGEWADASGSDMVS